MELSLTVKIITIKSLFLEAEAELVILPGAEGELGILPQHIPLIVELKPGIVRIFSNKKELKYFVYDAVAEVTGEAVNILTNYAVDLLSVSKSEILTQISELENSLHQEINSANVAKIKAHLTRQQDLLKNIVGA